MVSKFKGNQIYNLEVLEKLYRSKKRFQLLLAQIRTRFVRSYRDPVMDSMVWVEQKKARRFEA